MNCPKCRNPKTYCVESRPHGNETRRRRVCEKCETRFTTVERLEGIIGQRQPKPAPVPKPKAIAPVVKANATPKATMAKTKHRVKEKEPSYFDDMSEDRNSDVDDICRELGIGFSDFD